MITQLRELRRLQVGSVMMVSIRAHEYERAKSIWTSFILQLSKLAGYEYGVFLAFR